MSRRSRCLLLIGGSLVLMSGGAVLAAGVADPTTDASGRLELAQVHEHGQRGSGEHAPSSPAQQLAPSIDSNRLRQGSRLLRGSGT